MTKLYRTAQDAVGTTGNPVIDVTFAGETLTVTYADGTLPKPLLLLAVVVAALTNSARDAAAAVHSQTRTPPGV